MIFQLFRGWHPVCLLSIFLPITSGNAVFPTVREAAADLEREAASREAAALQEAGEEMAQAAAFYGCWLLKVDS